MATGRTYSFLNMQGTLTGPGTSGIPLGNTANAAEEGITVEFVDDVNTMMIGAAGDGVHSLHATRAGRVTVHLLKGSPVNAALTSLYNTQRTDAALHGKNTIALKHTSSNDEYICQFCAFKKFPQNMYAKDANVINWEFDSIQIDPALGTLI